MTEIPKYIDIVVPEQQREVMRENLDELSYLFIDATFHSQTSQYIEMGDEYSETYNLFYTLSHNIYFGGAVFAKNGEEIVGMTTWKNIPLQNLVHAFEYPTTSPQLIDYVQRLRNTSGISDLVRLISTVVAPDEHEKGIGTALRRTAIQEITKQHQNGAIVLTDHQRNNKPIIQSSRSLGFVHSPITWSKGEPWDMWYLVIPPHQQSTR